MAALDYTTEGVPETDVLPAGIYNVQISNTEIRATKDGFGKILVLEMTVIDGQHKGRKHWENLNVVNKNETAQNIARRTQKQIENAIGCGPVRDTTVLHNRPFAVEFTVKDEGDYGIKNRIKKVMPFANPTPPGPQNSQPAPGAGAGTAPAGNQDRPWG